MVVEVVVFHAHRVAAFWAVEWCFVEQFSGDRLGEIPAHEHPAATVRTALTGTPTT